MEAILLLVHNSNFIFNQEEELVPPLRRFTKTSCGLFNYLADACIAKSLINTNPLTIYRMHTWNETSDLYTFIPFVINNACFIYTNIYSLVLNIKIWFTDIPPLWWKRNNKKGILTCKAHNIFTPISNHC